MARERTWTIALLTGLVLVGLGYELRHEPAARVPLLLPLLLGSALAAVAASQEKFTALEASLSLVGAGGILGIATATISWNSATLPLRESATTLSEAVSLSLWTEAGAWLGATWACWMGVVACLRSPTRRSLVLTTAAMILGGVAGAAALPWLSDSVPYPWLPRRPIMSGFAIGLTCMVFVLSRRERDRTRRGLRWLLSGLAIAPAAMLDGFFSRVNSPGCVDHYTALLNTLAEVHDGLTSRSLVSLGVALAAGALVFLARSRERADLAHLGVVGAFLLCVVGSGALLGRESFAGIAALYVGPTKARVEAALESSARDRSLGVWSTVYPEPTVTLARRAIGAEGVHPPLHPAAFGWVSLDLDLAQERGVHPDTPFGEVLDRLRR